MGKVKDFYAMQDDINIDVNETEGIIVEELFDDETLDSYFGCNLADVDIETFNIKQE